MSNPAVTKELASGSNQYIHDVNDAKAKPETQTTSNCSQKLLWAEFWEIVGCYSHLEKRQCMYFLCFGSCWNLDLTVPCMKNKLQPDEETKWQFEIDLSSIFSYLRNSDI